MLFDAGRSSNPDAAFVSDLFSVSRALVGGGGVEMGDPIQMAENTWDSLEWDFTPTSIGVTVRVSLHFFHEVKRGPPLWAEFLLASFLVA